METAIPFIIAAILFPVSFFHKSMRRKPIVAIVAGCLAIYFVVMAFFDPPRMYFSLLFALFAGIIAVRTAKTSGIFKNGASDMA